MDTFDGLSAFCIVGIGLPFQSLNCDIKHLGLLLVFEIWVDPQS